MILETERLTISNFTLDDAPFIYKLVNDPDWLYYIGDRNVKSLKDAENYLENTIIKHCKENGFGFYIVCLKDEKTPIGTCGLIRRDWMDYIDIGYGFLPDYRGKGYAIEAATAVKNFAKEKLQIKRLAAMTNLDNDRSGHLLLKLGFQFEKNIVFPGEDAECKLYLEKDY